MARDQRGLPKEKTASKRVRGAQPSFNVPGDGKITKEIGQAMDNRSAAHYADAMGFVGGSAGSHQYEGQG